MDTVGDYWDAIEKLLEPFPRNNTNQINEQKETMQHIIRKSWDEHTPDLDILDFLYCSVRDAVADFKNHNLYVRVFPEITLDTNIENVREKNCYVRLQYIQEVLQ